RAEPRRPDEESPDDRARRRKRPPAFGPPLQRPAARRPDGRRRHRARRGEAVSSVTEPKTPPANRLGLTVKEYGGLKSTLCVGCGHDVITKQITQAFYEMGVEPHRVAKLSGIGCSSKT